MGVKVEELTDDNIAYILSALVDLKKVYKDNNSINECENVEKLILMIQDSKVYIGGSI